MEMLKKPDIISGLKALGIKPGMEIEVHSSMSSFGHVDGGAETVIAALKESVGNDGSIFMPALRLSRRLPLTARDEKLGIVTKIEILPADCEKSGMGAIADTFRKMPDTRLGEGVFRTAAWGKSAAEVSGGLRHLIDHGGKALMLGVDIYSLTSMHYVEGALPQKIRDIFKPGEEVNRIYPPDEWLVETGEPPVKAWYKIQDMAYERGLIASGMIGSGRAMLFDIREVVGLYEKELKDNPYGLYGLE